MYKKTCLNCRLEVEDLKHCSRCRIAGYCSQACQKEAFKDHKKLCKAMSQLVAELQEEDCFLFEHCTANPTMPWGKFSWAFVRDFMCNNASTDGRVAPEEVKGKLMRLKAVVCVEGNLEAAREYVRAEWIYRHKYSVLLEDSSVVDLPLMLLALGRTAEVENVIKKVFMDLLRVKPCPENPPTEFFSVKRYVSAFSSMPLDERRYPFLVYGPPEAFLLLMCYGAWRATLNRPVFEAATETVYEEIFNEESFFNKLQGKDPVVAKILGELERDLVTHAFGWAEQQASQVHTLNKSVLGGIVDPATVLDYESDWTAAYKKAFWSKNLPLRWRDRLGLVPLQQEDEVVRLCAKWILLGAMPICRLAGIYDTLREVASKVAAA